MHSAFLNNSLEQPSPKMELKSLGAWLQIKHCSFFSPTLLDRPVKDPLIVGQIKINDFLAPPLVGLLINSEPCMAYSAPKIVKTAFFFHFLPEL